MSAYFTTRQTVSKAKSRTLRLLLTRSGFPKTKKLPYQNSNEDESPFSTFQYSMEGMNDSSSNRPDIRL